MASFRYGKTACNIHECIWVTQFPETSVESYYQDVWCTLILSPCIDNYISEYLLGIQKQCVSYRDRLSVSVCFIPLLGIRWKMYLEYKWLPDGNQTSWYTNVIWWVWTYLHQIGSEIWNWHEWICIYIYMSYQHQTELEVCDLFEYTIYKHTVVTYVRHVSCRLGIYEQNLLSYHEN